MSKALVNGIEYSVGGGEALELEDSTLNLIGGGKVISSVDIGRVVPPGEGEPIGGRIFYVADGYNGATYKFYDILGNEVTTATVDGLATAVTYTRVGTPTFDKFYAYADNGSGIITSSELQWGGYGTLQGTTQDGIGVGKVSSATLLNNLGGTAGTIWNYLKGVKDSSLCGCDDWFIGSKAELDKLRNSNTPGKSFFNSHYVWSCVERNSYSSWNWGYSRSGWNDDGKDNSSYCMPLRAF